MTAVRLTLLRTRKIPSGPVNFWAFDESNPRDFEALERLRRAVPDRKEAVVDVDFDPATSQALNRPARELVEVERDRLAGLLREARAFIGLPGIQPKPDALLARIDAALPTEQQSNGEAA
jgi:hypothetical protein